MRGIGNYLFWSDDGAIELSWIPPLTPSQLIFKDDRLVFKNFFSSEEIYYKNIQFIRKLSKPKTYYHFIGAVNGKGFKLSFMPIFSSSFSKKLKEKKLLVSEEVKKWNLSTEDGDRIKFNLPQRPTG